MRKSEITAEFDAEITTVWNRVTDNVHYEWRSDLDRIVLSEGGERFTEYTKDGYATEFTITVKEFCKRYEFDMENKNFSGHWTGIFTELEGGRTRIDFTEVLHMKNPVMELLSYLFMNLRKMQKVYVDDLRKALGE